MLRIEQLQAFCSVAAELHVTRAAKKLQIAQPSLTQQIRILEREVGIKLFRKQGRGIALTEGGQTFYQEAQIILRQIEAAVYRAQASSRGNLGRLNIGLTEGAAFNRRIAYSLSKFKNSWPGVDVEFIQALAIDLPGMLRQGRIDAMFTCLPAPDAGDLHYQQIAKDGFALALPATHPLAKRISIDLRYLDKEPIILVAQEYTPRLFEVELLRACDDLGFAPRIVQRSPELMLALNLVATGMGVCFVPIDLLGWRIENVVYRSLVQSVRFATDLMFVTRSGEESLSVANLKATVAKVFRKKSLQ